MRGARDATNGGASCCIVHGMEHPDHRNMKVSAGRGFDPEKLDVAATNEKLAALWKRLRRG